MAIDFDATNNERPYWLWHAMLERLAALPCEQDGDCESLCVTEQCLPCAARAFAPKGDSDAE